MKFLLFFAFFLSGLQLAQAEREPGSNIIIDAPTEQGRFKRPFNIDNGGVVDSPITAEPGTWQIESELISYSYVKNEGITDKTTTYNNTIVRRAVSESFDLELGHISYVHKQAANHDQGTGDAIARFKWTFFGDYTTQTAAALFPYIKIPTGAESISGHKPEGGIALPISHQLNERFNLGVMPIWSYVPKSEGPGHYWSHRFALCLSYQFNDQLDGYVETYQQVDADKNNQGLALGTIGLNVELTPYVLVDFGSFFGFSAAAPKYSPYLGLTARF